MTTTDEYLNIPIEDKLRRTAHHEAGHIVVAAQQGLPLRSDGMCVDLKGGGLACYWKEPEDNDLSRRSVILSTFAGFSAEEEFCKLHSLPAVDGIPLIWSPDWNEARRIISRLSSLSPTDTAFMIDQRLQDQSRSLVREHWLAIEAIVDHLLSKEWETIKPLESGNTWSEVATAKYISGQELISLLAAFEIHAICRQ
jgi:hypothetical protein